MVMLRLFRAYCFYENKKKERKKVKTKKRNKRRKKRKGGLFYICWYCSRLLLPG